VENAANTLNEVLGESGVIIKNKLNDVVAYQAPLSYNRDIGYAKRDAVLVKLRSMTEIINTLY